MQLSKIVSIGFLFIIALEGCIYTNNTKTATIIFPTHKVYNQFQPKIIWHRSVGQNFSNFYSDLHLACQNNLVFSANRHGIVKALNINNGKEVWSTDLSIYDKPFFENYSAKLSSGITISGNRIYLGSELAKVYALRIEDGTIIWETTVAGEALSTPTVSEGTVLIHTSNGILQSLNENNGKIQWTVSLDVSPLTLRGESSPAIAFGVAIVGDDDGCINAIMLDSGDRIWQQRISSARNINEIERLNDIKITPIVINGFIYAIAYNGNLAALDLYSGHIIWMKEIGSINNLIVDNNKIYLVDQNNRIIAINAQNGIVLWDQKKLLHHNLTSPVLCNGYIIVGDSKGYLYWLDANNGKFIAQKKIDITGFTIKPIIINKNKIVVQARNGEIYAIKT